MVAHVLRLRIALLLGSLRPGRRARSIAGFLLVAVLTVAVCIAILSLGEAPLPVARAVIVLGAAVTMLGFLLAPIVVGAVDQLDPRRFAVFGVDERTMPGVLALGALVSVPSLAFAAACVCVVIVVVAQGAAWLPVVLMALVALFSATLAARIGMAVNIVLLPERRPRELTAIFVLAVVVLAFPVALFLASLAWDDTAPAAVLAAAEVAEKTPFGAAAGFGFALADGSTGGAWSGALIAIGTLVVLALLWWLLVRRLLLTTERPLTSRERTGLGWFALLPANAFGAIAARSLVYWLHDRRYIVNFVVVPIAGVLSALPLLVAGVPLQVAVLIPVPVIALFFGWLPHNDIAYDSTAFWTHVVSGVPGFFDRLGRLIPITLITVPVLAIAIPLSLSIAGNWHLLLPLTGLAASLFLSGLGLSSISSVVSPYGVSHPGDSPFRQPQRSASRGSFGQAGAFIGAIVLSAPTIYLFTMTVIDPETSSPSAFWVGLGTGVAVLLLGALIGGALYNRSGERLMEFVETV